MTAGERLRAKFNATGCFRLTGETSADWETAACAAGIDGLEEEIAALLADLFPTTAGPDRLDAWERLARPDCSTADLSLRREMLAARLSARPTDRRAEDFSRLLPGAGLRGAVTESGGQVIVLAARPLGLGQAEILRELEELLPAHLAWSVTWPTEFNWAVRDAWAPAFDRLDARGLTWQELDGLTLEDLPGLNDNTEEE